MLHTKIKTAESLSEEAFKELDDLQSGRKKLIKTGRAYIDNHLGGLKPSDLVLLGAMSGVGKTYELMRISRGILDKNINPFADKYVTLEFMLEMKFLDLILRDTHRITDKKKSDILTEEFTEEEQLAINEYRETLKDGRRYVVDESVSTNEFLDICRSFCIKNKDKDAIIISLDHLLLVTGVGGEDPLATIATYTNILRKEFGNVYFIYLSQLNRNYPPEIKDNSNDMVPLTRHIFGSSHFEFLSAYVLVMTNPFKLGIENYLKVKQDRYPNLSEFISAVDNKQRASYGTIGNIFYHVLKTRESDVPYDNLFIEEMNLSKDQKQKLEMDRKETNEITIDAPRFNSIKEEIDFLDMAKFRDEDIKF